MTRLDATLDRTVGDDLLTISEVAAIVRAPIATLRYWRHLGTGPRSFRLGRRVVYRAGDLQAWIALQASNPCRRTVQ
ncbi:MAG: helix-turn-helix transcriptional regulator [Propionibacteriaceae bacterium]